MVVKEKESTPRKLALKGLGRIEAQEEKLRREKIALLRGELAKARERVQILEHELRALGDPEASRAVGWVNWEGIYEQLPARFSAIEVAVMTGVRPGHVASVMHRWRAEGRIAATARGKYKKIAPHDVGGRK